MRFAYADPPYPGLAHRHYHNHPDYRGEVDHAELIRHLCRDYPDGWALSTAQWSLRDVLTLCPPDVQVAVWHNTDSRHPGSGPARWWQMWEPVIVRGGRQRAGDAPVVRNLLACGRPLRPQVRGQKPVPFCRWVFALLGARPGDTMDDLFPGSGAVTREWQAFQAQEVLTA